MKKTLLILALAFAGALFAAEAPKAVTPAAPTPTPHEDPIATLTKERDALKAELATTKEALATAKQQFADLAQKADARLSILERQRNEYNNQVVNVSADLSIAQVQIQALQKQVAEAKK